MTTKDEYEQQARLVAAALRKISVELDSCRQDNSEHRSDIVALLESKRAWGVLLDQTTKERDELKRERDVMCELGEQYRDAAMFMSNKCDQLAKERDELKAKLEIAKEGLNLMLQAFDQRWPGACHQKCFNDYGEHSCEIEEIAINQAREALSKIGEVK